MERNAQGFVLGGVLGIAHTSACMHANSQYLKQPTQVSLRMEQEAGELEIAAHPALDALTKHINSINLERVRRIKNKLARLLNNKVEKLKEILEGLLDDDSDLRDMNLTARRERERLEKEREMAMERVRCAHMGLWVYTYAAYASLIVHMVSHHVILSAHRCCLGMPLSRRLPSRCPPCKAERHQWTCLGSN